MTFYQFRLATPAQQLGYALHHGQYLAQRWEREHHRVNLYFCDDGGRGYFVEVGIDEMAECFVNGSSGGVRNYWPCETTA